MKRLFTELHDEIEISKKIVFLDPKSKEQYEKLSRLTMQAYNSGEISEEEVKMIANSNEELSRLEESISYLELDLDTLRKRVVDLQERVKRPSPLGSLIPLIKPVGMSTKEYYSKQILSRLAFTEEILRIRLAK